MFTSAFMMGTAGVGLFVINTTSAENNINLRTKLDAANFNNDVESTIIYNLDAGVTVGSNTTATDPAWQTGTISNIHTLTVNIGGVVYGMGGEGAPEASTGSPFACPTPQAGGVGGNALSFEHNAVVNLLPTSIVKSGGGGGGQGANGIDIGDDYETFEYGQCGGRGQGFATLTGPVDGCPTKSGDENSYGGAGGNGGVFGSNGQNGSNGQVTTCSVGIGGAGGNAVKKNGYTVTVYTSGTVVGTVG